MKVHGNILLIILLNAAVCSFAQKEPLPIPDIPHDSVVRIYTEDFWHDSSGIFVNQVIVYNLGKEVYNLTTEYNQDVWRDSTCIEIFYNNHGEIQSSVLRRSCPDECPPPAATYPYAIDFSGLFLQMKDQRQNGRRTKRQ